MKFMPCAKPADLLVASIVAELFSPVYLQAGIGGARNRGGAYCAAADSVRLGVRKFLKLFDRHQSLFKACVDFPAYLFHKIFAVNFSDGETCRRLGE